jgi:glutamate-1-semialdehyde 2,1-aminomutase
MVLKIRGGWHGVQPWSVIDVISTNYLASTIECAGMPDVFVDRTVTVPFNDPEKLASAFKRYADRIGVVIAELVLGNAGMEMASLEFANALRQHCDRCGAVLVLDEIVTGFRTSLGPLSDAYHIRPDIGTYGKAICGGMPFAAITGRRDVLASIHKSASPRVLADSGTFTSHPATLRAVLDVLTRLESDGDRLYPLVAATADGLRKGLVSLFERFDVPAHVTGGSPDPSVPGFPIMTVRFLADAVRYNSAVTMQHWDTGIVDTLLSQSAAFSRGRARVSLRPRIPDRILRRSFRRMNSGLGPGIHADE